MRPSEFRRGDRAFIVGILDQKVPNGQVVTLEKWCQNDNKWLVSACCTKRHTNAIFYLIRATNLQHEDEFPNCSNIHPDLYKVLRHATKQSGTQELCRSICETYFDLMCTYYGIKCGSICQRKLLSSFLEWIGNKGDGHLLNSLEKILNEECDRSDEFVKYVINPKMYSINNLTDVGDFMKKTRFSLIEQIELNRSNLNILVAKFKIESRQVDVWKYMGVNADRLTTMQSRKDVIGGTASEATKQYISICRSKMKERLIGGCYGDSLNLAYCNWMMNYVLGNIPGKKQETMFEPQSHNRDVPLRLEYEEWEEDLTSSFRITAETISIELRSNQWNQWLNNFGCLNMIPCIDLPSFEADRRLLKLSIFSELACESVSGALSAYREHQQPTRLSLTRNSSVTASSKTQNVGGSIGIMKDNETKSKIEKRDRSATTSSSLRKPSSPEIRERIRKRMSTSARRKFKVNTTENPRYTQTIETGESISPCNDDPFSHDCGVMTRWEFRGRECGERSDSTCTPAIPNNSQNIEAIDSVNYCSCDNTKQRQAISPDIKLLDKKIVDEKRDDGSSSNEICEAIRDQSEIVENNDVRAQEFGSSDLFQEASLIEGNQVYLVSEGIDVDQNTVMKYKSYSVRSPDFVIAHSNYEGSQNSPFIVMKDDRIETILSGNHNNEQVQDNDTATSPYSTIFSIQSRVSMEITETNLLLNRSEHLEDCFKCQEVVLHTRQDPGVVTGIHPIDELDPIDEVDPNVSFDSGIELAPQEIDYNLSTATVNSVGEKKLHFDALVGKKKVEAENKQTFCGNIFSGSSFFSCLDGMNERIFLLDMWCNHKTNLSLLNDGSKLNEGAGMDLTTNLQLTQSSIRLPQYQMAPQHLTSKNWGTDVNLSIDCQYYCLHRISSCDDCEDGQQGNGSLFQSIDFAGNSVRTLALDKLDNPLKLKILRRQRYEMQLEGVSSTGVRYFNNEECVDHLSDSGQIKGEKIAFEDCCSRSLYRPTFAERAALISGNLVMTSTVIAPNLSYKQLQDKKYDSDNDHQRKLNTDLLSISAKTLPKNGEQAITRNITAMISSKLNTNDLKPMSQFLSIAYDVLLGMEKGYCTSCFSKHNDFSQESVGSENAARHEIEVTSNLCIDSIEQSDFCVSAKGLKIRNEIDNNYGEKTSGNLLDPEQNIGPMNINRGAFGRKLCSKSADKNPIVIFNQGLKMKKVKDRLSTQPQHPTLHEKHQMKVERPGDLCCVEFSISCPSFASYFKRKGRAGEYFDIARRTKVINQEDSRMSNWINIREPKQISGLCDQLEPPTSSGEIISDERNTNVIKLLMQICPQVRQELHCILQYKQMFHKSDVLKLLMASVLKETSKLSLLCYSKRFPARRSNAVYTNPKWFGFRQRSVDTSINESEYSKFIIVGYNPPFHYSNIGGPKPVQKVEKCDQQQEIDCSSCVCTTKIEIQQEKTLSNEARDEAKTTRLPREKLKGNFLETEETDASTAIDKRLSLRTRKVLIQAEYQRLSSNQRPYVCRQYELAAQNEMCSSKETFRYQNYTAVECDTSYHDGTDFYIGYNSTFQKQGSDMVTRSSNLVEVDGRCIIQPEFENRQQDTSHLSFEPREPANPQAMKNEFREDCRDDECNVAANIEHNQQRSFDPADQCASFSNTYNAYSIDKPETVSVVASVKSNLPVVKPRRIRNLSPRRQRYLKSLGGHLNQD